MAVIVSPNINPTGLMLALDATNSRSYPGTGNTWYDVSGNNYNFTLNNSPSFTTHKNTPCFTTNAASSQKFVRNGSFSQDFASNATIFFVISSLNNNSFGAGGAGGCSRLMACNAGELVNVDFSSYFCLASCDTSRYGLWYKNSPGGLYPTSVLQTVNDDFKIITIRWTAGSSAQYFVNGVQESTSSITSAFNYASIARMTLCSNADGIEEFATLRIAGVYMYARNMSNNEIKQNYNALRVRYGL
jgi:hypothetical protein